MLIPREMSVSAAVAASTRPRKESRTSSPKFKTTPSGQQTESEEEIAQRQKRRNNPGKPCCILMVLSYLLFAVAFLTPESGGATTNLFLDVS